jgi:hypothetical protein
MKKVKRKVSYEMLLYTKTYPYNMRYVLSVIRSHFVFQDSTEYDEDLSTDGVPTTSNEDEEDYLPSQVDVYSVPKVITQRFSKPYCTT